MGCCATTDKCYKPQVAWQLLSSYHWLEPPSVRVVFPAVVGGDKWNSWWFILVLETQSLPHFIVKSNNQRGESAFPPTKVSDNWKKCCFAQGKSIPYGKLTSKREKHDHWMTNPETVDFPMSRKTTRRQLMRQLKSEGWQMVSLPT